MEDPHFSAVHDQELLVTIHLRGNGAPKPLVHAVVLQLVDHVLEVHEGIVDGLHGDVRVGHRSAEHKAANAAEAVDAHASRHGAGAGVVEGSGFTKIRQNMDL